MPAARSGLQVQCLPGRRSLPVGHCLPLARCDNSNTHGGSLGSEDKACNMSLGFHCVVLQCQESEPGCKDNKLLREEHNFTWFANCFQRNDVDPSTFLPFPVQPSSPALSSPASTLLPSSICQTRQRCQGAAESAASECEILLLVKP